MASGGTLRQRCGVRCQVDPPVEGNPRLQGEQVVMPGHPLWLNNATTVGGGSSVLNVWSEPLLVPPELTARTLKWYSVAAVSPASDDEVAAAEAPLPTSGAQGALDP